MFGFRTRSKVLNPVLPDITNSDGEALEFLSVHFRLAPAANPAAIGAALASVPEFRQENDRFWNWVESKAAERGRWKTRGESFVTMMDDGGIVLGNLELRGKTLTLAVNSETRAARGRALIQAHLAGMVREPLVERQTLQQMMAAGSVSAEGSHPQLPRSLRSRSVRSFTRVLPITTRACSTKRFRRSATPRRGRR